MATTLRTLARPALRASSTLTARTSIRTKVTLPDLKYDYSALEPAISGQIMELHHSKHHQTYVNGYNDASEKLASASDPKAQIALQHLINFHGGGHINHSLFWENLAPKSQGGGELGAGELSKAIDAKYGRLGEFQKKFNAALAGIQGSGWTWLVKGENGLEIQTYANQNPVVKGTALLGVDAWEHAYYLQYQNRKAEYFNAIWDVINWKTVEERYKK